jgi:CRISPR system Cascade subunit CasB
MEPPYGAMMCEGYGALRHSLLEHMPLQPLMKWRWRCLPASPAHIKKHNEKTSLPRSWGKNSTARRRAFLLYVLNVCKRPDPQTFCQLLIHAVTIRGHEGVNVLSLADSIFLWMEEWQRREEHQSEPRDPFERNRIRWANEYLSAL